MSGKTVIARSCTAPVAEDKLASNEQIDFDKDHFSAATDRNEKNFAELPCKESPAIKPDSSAPTQTTPANKSVNHEHDGNGSDRLAAPSNPLVFEADTRTQLLTRLSVLTTEPVDSLRLNTALASALDRYPDRANDALKYFQQAIATWKNRPGIGLFIHAVKSGQKPSLTKPGCGWKEWADEAVKRRLQYSHSHDGDIMVHFALGGQELWSRLRSLSWEEVELVASGGEQR